MKRLTFALRRHRYALDASDVLGIAPADRIRPLPLAAPPIAGIADWRGDIVTVVDVVPLLDDVPAEPSRVLVRLAPPWDHTALLIRANVVLDDGGGDPARELRPDDLLAAV